MRRNLLVIHAWATAWFLHAILPVAPTLATPPAPAAVDPATAREQIQGTLAAMRDAVLAARPDDYLIRVWQGEPEWSTEQKNWAADLRRRVPESFEFTVGDVTPGEAPGWMVGPVRIVWSFTGQRPREIAFTARFFQDPQQGWLYAGEKWNMVEQDGVRVLYGEGDEAPARMVVAELPGVRAHVLAGFGLQGQPIESRVQQVKLYSSMRHLQHSIYLGYTDPLGGWNEPGESIKLMVAGVRGRTSARVLLAHEYGHVATFELGPHASAMPWWALEGIAELASEKFSGKAGRTHTTVAGWARSGRLVEWDRLADFHGEATQHYAQVYAQGHSMLGFISERFGRDARNQWLTLLAQGQSLDEASRRALELPFAELDARWREALGAAEAKPAPGRF